MADTNRVASHAINASPVQALKRSRGGFALLFRSSRHFCSGPALRPAEYLQKSLGRRCKVVAAKLHRRWCTKLPRSCWRVRRRRIGAGAVGPSVAARWQRGWARTALVAQRGERGLVGGSLARRSGCGGMLPAGRSARAPGAASGVEGFTAPCRSDAPVHPPPRSRTHSRRGGAGSCGPGVPRAARARRQRGTEPQRRRGALHRADISVRCLQYLHFLHASRDCV